MKRLLVVDDLQEIRDLLSEVLSWEGYSVATAADGETARKLIAEGGLSLVLLDVVLPAEGGLPVAEYAASLGTKVILMSGSSRVLEAPERFPWPVVAKPFRLGKLVATVRTALEPPSPP
jgi:two-component system nitrogen regulation response regulator NtrX